MNSKFEYDSYNMSYIDALRKTGYWWQLSDISILEDQKKREKPPPAPKSREVSKRVSDVKVSKVKNPVLFSDDEDDARGMVWNISFFLSKISP